MFVFLFIIAAASINFPISHAASKCDVCGLTEEFIPSNGYNCFPLSNGRVACTCPDQRYTLNEPCRICQRPNICGDSPNNLCSEVLDTISSTQDGDTHHFSCFCTDLTFHIGQACPSNSSTTVTTTTIAMTSAVTTAVPATTAQAATVPTTAAVELTTGKL